MLPQLFQDKKCEQDKLENRGLGNGEISQANFGVFDGGYEPVGPLALEELADKGAHCDHDAEPDDLGGAFVVVVLENHVDVNKKHELDEAQLDEIRDEGLVPPRLDQEVVPE